MTAPTSAGHELLFVPLGGAGEIGMNLNLYGYDGAWVMVDLGITFANDALPGIDVIMPDPGFIVERRDDLLGLVLTHAHEDHLGAVPYLWEQLRCPVYGTRFTLEILKRKLDEGGLAGEVPLVEVPRGGEITLGPFHFTYISITHSIPESNALAIRTPVGTVLHTGDFKIDPEPVLGPLTDRERLMALGDSGVLAMVGDSTNVFVPGTSGSEGKVRTSLEDLVGRFSGRVAVTTFASHIARIMTLAAVAEAHDRHTALVGRSLWRTVSAARSAGYLNGMPSFLTDSEAAYLPKDKVLLVCTGSQGEPRGAMARIAAQDHPHIVLDEGDVAIFSAKIIPGNERSHAEVHNRLVQRGVRVITEKDHFVHVSGHPARDELADMYRWVRPRIAVPVHGEGRHLAEHAAFAKALQVPETVVAENGTVVRLASGRAGIIGRVPAGRLLLDGERLVPADSEVVRTRRKLAQGGFVLVMLVIGADGTLLTAPRLTVRGAHDEAVAGELAHEVTHALAELGSLSHVDDDRLEKVVSRAVRRALKRTGGKRAMVETEIIRLAGAARPDSAAGGDEVAR